MDRATEAAAHDLAEVRKLIEGMNALVNSQALQQQQQQQQTDHSTPSTLPSFPSAETSYVHQETNEAAFVAAATAAAAAAAAANNTATSSPAAANATNTPSTEYSQGVIVEVNHLMFNRTLYFQLAPDATIEPLITWLRMSFSDNSISGMVLQYKGSDELWKCLLNRDDSLKRILKQTLKGTNMLQMRVPREQDLLSSGYTDRRLLALTKPGA
ncbi:hypothetical protein DFQ28_008110 [Apophysomyces sp. BC1034]|nr:hypothetical protein DFQ30_006934 [Apophysomyces sp. BC1015]KAG0181518.1 hypothetical protein DFQ29_008074 [Apophysomyces sp. BC1021]KAG0192720.1 hypothetical protein DFQ28_008110 [Apophysomyces sp. BC1034]